jgi:predicted Zn-dependent protease
VVTAICVLTSLCDGAVTQVAINVAGQAWFARHSREDEAEADSAGIFAVMAAGISPAGIPSFFETLLEERQRQPTLLDDWFSSHPLEEERVTRTRAIIEALPEAQVEGLASDADDFRAIKARLQQLPPAPQMTRPAQ